MLIDVINKIKALKVGLLPLTLAIFGSFRVFGGPLGGTYWTGLFFATGFIALLHFFRSSKIWIDFYMIVLILYLLVNVIINRPPSIFNSELRLALYFFLLCISSPLFQNYKMRNFRRETLYTLLNCFVLISVISFFCFFLGINWMDDQTGHGEFYDDFSDSSGAGHFGGITYHSMTLGFLSSIATCYLLFQYFRNPKKITLFLLFLCLGSLFFASSRIALGAMLCAGLTIIKRKSDTKTSFVKTVLAVFFVIVVTSPLWLGAMAGILIKQASRGDVSDFGGRLTQIESRIYEIKENPVFGVGFAAVDVEKSYVGEDGQIEPGPSWLTVFSMTGFVGGTIMILLFILCYNSLEYIKYKRLEYALLSGLIVFMIIHLCVEGYIFAGGSVECFIMWLILGCARDARYENDNSEM